jgi:hypothetical protein
MFFFQVSSRYEIRSGSFLMVEGCVLNFHPLLVGTIHPGSPGTRTCLVYKEELMRVVAHPSLRTRLFSLSPCLAPAYAITVGKYHCNGATLTFPGGGGGDGNVEGDGDGVIDQI